ncbi:MAG: N-acetyl-gamma-glutamyl-phosphate reductase, partial [Acidithiobacillus sp.]|nr:N-acetyl-gamma-glutamyl-phosphate reductase [Acidithiobacillus sp.]
QPMSDAALQDLFATRYAGEPFVDVLPFGSHPATRSVRGANMCHIAVHQPRPGQVVVLSVIDNLVKGAAGQAIQNMNRLFSLAEDAGLMQIALLP